MKSIERYRARLPAYGIIKNMPVTYTRAGSGGINQTNCPGSATSTKLAPGWELPQAFTEDPAKRFPGGRRREVHPTFRRGFQMSVRWIAWTAGCDGHES
jgi:hypothetical protein